MRIKKMKASNAAHLMPLYGYWRGNSRPVCLFPNREGVPVGIDIFDPGLPNYNGVVLGGSGGGKSFAVLQIALMLHGQEFPPKIIWIDNGASSKQTVQALGGQFMELDLDKTDFSLNIFDLQKGEDSPNPSKVRLILAVLESILKDEEEKGLPKRDKSLLEEMIFSMYEKTKGIPLLEDLRDLLAAHSSSRMQSYAKVLYSWTNGVCGNIVNRKTSVKLDADLAAVEIKGLDLVPDLQNVLLLLFTDFIRKEAAEDLERPYLLLIDEGWKLFETPCGKSFAIEAYRTFRKFNAGIWMISQNYRDFLGDEEIANAILPNTATVAILPQKKIDWENFAARMGLTKKEVENVKSLQTLKGEYSELFFMQDENRCILRITPDSFSYFLCTSDAKDKMEIEKMKRKHPDLPLTKIIEKIIDQK